MKIPVLLAFLSLGGLAAHPLHAAETTSVESTQAPLTAEQIDQLLAPVALYPDPLVAIILPAATFPADIVMAARYLEAKRDPDAIEDQSWDDSVKALARYPEVVAWMDENLEWTRQLGEAFTLQPAAVLTGTQRLRAAAIAAGNLKTTPEQTVIVEKEIVRIVPAQREVIYIPVYDPYLVYRPSVVHVHRPAPLITFSIGHRTGFWLSYHFNWGVNSIVIVNRPYRAVVWHNYPGWVYPSHTVVHYHHVWRPAPVVVQRVRHDYARRTDHRIVQPTVNVHAQRNTNREINRAVNRPANTAPASSPRGNVAANDRDRDRDGIRTRDRNADDSPRQTRPENRDVVRRPATTPDPARTPAATPSRERTERGNRAVATTPRPAPAPSLTRPAPSRPTTPAPAIQQQPQSPSRNLQGVREPRQLTAPRVSEAPRTPTPARVAPATTPTTRPAPTVRTAPPAAPVQSAPTAQPERATRPNIQTRTPERAPRQPVVVAPAAPGLEGQTGRRDFNRTR